MSPMNEDELVQRTTAEYLRDELRWEYVYAFNTETFGPDGTLGRGSDREVVLTRYLLQKLKELNRGFAEEVYEDAVRKFQEYGIAQTLLATNQDKHELLLNGVEVTFRNEAGDIRKETFRLIDFQNPENNHFLCVRELWVRGDLYRRRADIIGFVNGIPVLFVELKNIHRDLRACFEKNLADYRDTVPHLLRHNEIIVLANGVDAKIGTLSSRYEHFHEWKRLEETEPGIVDMETLLKRNLQ